jgi:hypothetical protein
MLLRTESLIGREERSFVPQNHPGCRMRNSLRSLRIPILTGCDERSFVAMLLRTVILAG